MKSIIITHELGHDLGLSHSTSTATLQGAGNNVGWNPNSDYESRLMSDRSGAKRSSLPRRLIKAEWDKAREFDGFTSQAP